jgi:hypothetical protein
MPEFPVDFRKCLLIDYVYPTLCAVTIHCVGDCESILFKSLTTEDTENTEF